MFAAGLMKGNFLLLMPGNHYFLEKNLSQKMRITQKNGY